MKRETIFSERERFSGNTAGIMETLVAQLPPVGQGACILISAASYLSFPASDRWTDKRERRRLGMEKSSVPEPSRLEICTAQSGDVARCGRPLRHLGDHAQYPERGDFGPMNETCRHCHTTKKQTGTKWGYCDSCGVMLSVWG